VVKQFNIKVNIVTGEVEFENQDEMNYFEILGAMGVAKLILTEEYMNETEV
jgi:aldehyde:ferredoxin oxidoreductase